MMNGKRVSLTQEKIDQALQKPPEKPRYLRDEKGLLLRVQPTGAASWIYRYDWRGRRYQLGLGSYAQVSLAEARIEHNALRGYLLKGLNPRDCRQVVTAGTIEALIHEYLKHHVEKRQLKSYDFQRGMLHRHLKDYLHYPLELVTTRLLVTILDEIAAKTPGSAMNIHSSLRMAFRVAVQRGLMITNPMADVAAPASYGVRERVLTDSEIRELWTWTERTAIAARLLLLTGCRTDEILKTRYDEIDGDRLLLPAERTKTGRSRVVYLSRQALAQIEVLAQNRDSDFLFPGQRRRGLYRGAVAHYVKAQRVGWQPHDLRRTFRTAASRVGGAEHIKELAIGHEREKLLRTYDQHDFASELRDLVQRIGNELEGVVHP